MCSGCHKVAEGIKTDNFRLQVPGCRASGLAREPRRWYPPKTTVLVVEQPRRHISQPLGSSLDLTGSMVTLAVHGHLQGTLTVRKNH